MPSFSSSLTNDASVKRAGGWVKCCLGVTLSRPTVAFSVSPFGIIIFSGSWVSPFSVFCSSGFLYTCKKPSNSNVEPITLNTRPLSPAIVTARCAYCPVHLAGNKAFPYKIIELCFVCSKHIFLQIQVTFLPK